MNINSIKALSKFEFRVNFMSPMNFIVMMVLYPIIFASNIPNVSEPGVPFLLAIFIFLQTVIATIMQVPLKEALNREDKVIKRLIVTPTTKFDYMISGIVVQFLTSSISVVIMSLIAYKAITIKMFIGFYFISFLLFLPMYLYSFVISQLINDPQAQKAVGMVSFLLFSIAINSDGFLANILYLLPINAIEHLFEAVILNTSLNLVPNLIVITIYCVIYGLIGIKLFKWE